MLNRAQRRQLMKGMNKRGVGYTRQYSSKRARDEYGTPDHGNAAKIQQMKESQSSSEDVEKSFFELLQQEDGFRKQCSDMLGEASSDELIATVEEGRWDSYLDMLSELEMAGKDRKDFLTAMLNRQAEINSSQSNLVSPEEESDESSDEPT